MPRFFLRTWLPAHGPAALQNVGPHRPPPESESAFKYDIQVIYSHFKI